MAWWLIVMLLAVGLTWNWRRRCLAMRWIRALRQMIHARENMVDNCESEPSIPPGLLLQWHITERCNLRCAHCYQDAYSGEELQFQELLSVLKQFKRLLARWRGETNRPVRGHITVTGGEPFVRRDFLDLLEVFSANQDHFTFAILTNGSLIDAVMARRLCNLSPVFVQVSVEGGRATHDKIRGKANFDATVSAIRHLVRARIRTLISFTASRMNFREFPEVARLGCKLGVSRVWADRLIPFGSASAIREQMLTPQETREFLEIMHAERIRATARWFGRTEITMHRALQFLMAGTKPYNCTAGNTLITVQPNGDLYPCRRMPICVGNVMETPLEKLYYESGLFRALRNRNKISSGCQECVHNNLCRGGLKCLSYAVTGDPFTADPGCWQASREYPSSSKSCYQVVPLNLGVVPLQVKHSSDRHH